MGMWKKAGLGVGGVVLLLAALAAAWHWPVSKGVSAPPELPTRIAWAEGFTRAYRVTLQASGVVDFSSLAGVVEPGIALPPAAQVAVSLQGVLWLRVLERREEGAATLAGLIADPQLHIGGSQQDAAALERVFVVDIDAQGRLSRLRLAEGLPAEPSSALHSVLDALQIVLPNTPSTQWSLFETVDGDPLHVTYRLSESERGQPPAWRIDKRAVLAPPRLIGSREQREVDLYPEGLGAEALRQARDKLGIQTTEHATQATLQLSTDSAQWLTSLQVEAHIVRERQRQRVGETRYHVSATLLDEARIAAGERRLPTSLSAALAALQKPWQNAVVGNEARSLLESLGVNPSPDAVAALYERLQGSRFADVEDMVLAYLRLYPERAGDLMNYLRSDAPGRLPARAELALWRLLAQSATPQSQDAMLEALTDTAHGQQAPMRAAMHLSEMGEPSEDTYARLLAFATGPADADEERRALAQTALLAAGALAGTGRFADDADAEALGKQIAEQLSQHYFATTDVAGRRAALAAIGNQGHADGLPAIADALQDDDGQVRTQAFDSLRHMPTALALPVLSEAYARESEPRARIAALGALAALPPTRQSFDWARSRVATPPSDVQEGRALVELLGASRSASPEAEGVLREWLRSNPPREIRAAIYEQVGVGG